MYPHLEEKNSTRRLRSTVFVFEPFEVIEESIVPQANVFRNLDLWESRLPRRHFPTASDRTRRASRLCDPGSMRRYAARIFRVGPMTYVTRFATPNRPRALYDRAIRLSGSATRSKLSPYRSRNARCEAASWTLTPSTSARKSLSAPRSSRNAHASRVHPGVSSSG